MATFEVKLQDWEIEEGVPVDLIVSGRCAAGGDRKSGRVDWVELDVKSIQIHNKHACPLPPVEVGKLCAQDKFLQAVEKEIEREGL